MLTFDSLSISLTPSDRHSHSHLITLYLHKFKIIAKRIGHSCCKWRRRIHNYFDNFIYFSRRIPRIEFGNNPSPHKPKVNAISFHESDSKPDLSSSSNFRTYSNLLLAIWKENSTTNASNVRVTIYIFRKNFSPHCEKPSPPPFFS